jgi:hypothetical protein
MQKNKRDCKDRTFLHALVRAGGDSLRLRPVLPSGRGRAVPKWSYAEPPRGESRGSHPEAILGGELIGKGPRPMATA